MAGRRLPVIQEPTGEDAEAAARPAWQWVLIGSGLLVTIWTPLVALALLGAGKISSRPSPGLAALLVAGCFAFSSVAAGYLVGRFGTSTRVRHAVLAGLAAALEIWLLALLGAAFPSLPVALSVLSVLGLVGAAFSALGSHISRRSRRPKPTSRTSS